MCRTEDTHHDWLNLPFCGWGAGTPSEFKVCAIRFMEKLLRVPRPRAKIQKQNTKNKLFVEDLTAQADTAKQALETRVRAQAVNPRVRFEKPGKVQVSLQIGFL
jgi:hypothetical protein